MHVRAHLSERLPQKLNVCLHLCLPRSPQPFPPVFPLPFAARRTTSLPPSPSCSRIFDSPPRQCHRNGHAFFSPQGSPLCKPMCLGSVLVPALLKVTALRFVQPLAAAGHVSDRFVNEGLGQALGGPVKTLHVLLARLALRLTLSIKQHLYSILQ